MMIVKVLRFLHRYSTNMVAYSGLLQLIKNKLTDPQKQFLKKIIYPTSRYKNNQIYKIRKRLYDLGFTERPLQELSTLANDSSNFNIRRSAAQELARWYANQGDENGVYRALEYLSIAKSGRIDSRNKRKNAIMESECLESLGNLESGKKVIKDALVEIGPEPNLYLAASNFEVDMGKKIKWINKTLGLYDLSPLVYSAELKEASIGCLRTNHAKNNKKLISDNLPLVSVIVAAYNAKSTIGNALQSIIEQTWPNLEIIVVDDGSDDNTVSVIEKYIERDHRIKLIKSEKNQGLFVSRNIALSTAKGEFVTSHDTDDWSHPEKMEKQVTNLIKRPLLMGNTSQMARTYPGLKFYRDSNLGNLISEFACSFMFRRKPVLNKIGYWDCVRFSADNEYIRRIIRVFGRNSVASLSTGPLTFYHRTGDSLTGHSAFGYPGYYMGARREYYEAQSYHHDRTDQLFYEFPQKKRPFPVPEPMWPAREETICGRRHFDIIIVSDFRKIGEYSRSGIEEIRAQVKMGLHTGLVQMSEYDLDPELKIVPEIRELLDGNRAQMLVYGERVSCDLLLVRDPSVLQEWQRYVPDIEANDVRVIVNQGPFGDYGSNNIFRYDIRKVQQHLEKYFGKPGLWYSVSPQVRD